MIFFYLYRFTVLIYLKLFNPTHTWFFARYISLIFDRLTLTLFEPFGPPCWFIRDNF